ncbi:putrescine-binding periplasmic protein-related [Euphorbia peplus]|nr:putrescine-binding periplasmic protein-related [Euphorbia peplus]
MSHYYLTPHLASSIPPSPLLLRYPTTYRCSGRRNLLIRSSEKPASSPEHLPYIKVAATSAIFLLGISFGAATSASASTSFRHALAVNSPETIVSQDDNEVKSDSKNSGSFEDEQMNAAFETWKSKTYALSVPLKIVALRGSMPPSWVKDFMASQGKRVKLRTKFLESLDNMFSDIAISFNKQKVGPSSVVAADLVSIGDSWLSYAIKKAIVEPIRDIEYQDWFKGLSAKWKVYLRRNSEGNIDPNGEIWAAPYRWGCMVIAYKKSTFQKNKLPPIEDWADLWKPELAGRISMVDSPREVVGAVLKYMGASYNTKNIEIEVTGGRNAVQENLASLGKQIRLFDSTHYLKAFGVGDVWVAVGWSSDVLPVAKRMSNVAVVVPSSGSSLWADLWAIPAASRIETNQIGGRVRGPSPLIHQWIEFCLQAGRAFPFKQEVIPGATPSALETVPVEAPKELTKGRPELDTNLIAGVPPPDIMSRCEFLEPLSDATLLDYELLISSMQKPAPGLIHRAQDCILSTIRSVLLKPHSKDT